MNEFSTQPLSRITDFIALTTLAMGACLSCLRSYDSGDPVDVWYAHVFFGLSLTVLFYREMSTRHSSTKITTTMRTGATAALDVCQRMKLPVLLA